MSCDAVGVAAAMPRDRRAAAQVVLPQRLAHVAIVRAEAFGFRAIDRRRRQRGSTAPRRRPDPARAPPCTDWSRKEDWDSSARDGADLLVAVITAAASGDPEHRTRKRDQRDTGHSASAEHGSPTMERAGWLPHSGPGGAAGTESSRENKKGDTSKRCPRESASSEAHLPGGALPPARDCSGAGPGPRRCVSERQNRARTPKNARRGCTKSSPSPNAMPP